MTARIKVAVFGASGYTGLELMRLLARHPGVELTGLTSREYQGRPVGEVFPALACIVDLAFVAPDPSTIATKAQVVFLAVPHKTAMELVPPLLAAGVRVVDLSADFRFRQQAVYEAWYQPHSAPELLEEAVYGLPELHRDHLPSARLVGNPGCYPTCVILGLAPLVKEGLVQTDSLIADCKSGVSGAGRGVSLATSYCEVTDSFRAYKVADHRHAPEMEQELTLLAGKSVKITFTPHLVPMSRGILGTLYGQLVKPLTDQDLFGLYQTFYRDHPFVRVQPPGTWPSTQQVRGSNYCDLGFKVDQERGRVIVLSAIDNLTRGASGLAVQNFNLMMGFPETLGLDLVPLAP
ncbi:MAG: N-acetyl-gamma-glutamyl-phosphate reductase [Syntrophobacterales bacterium]|jgi:N-acetyl-gamma-glutamyl-phosphate reductase